MTTPTNPPTPAPTPTIKRLKEELTGRNQDYGIVAELVDTLGFELAQARAALAAKDRKLADLKWVVEGHRPFNDWAQVYLDAGRWAGFRYCDAIMQELKERDAERDQLREEVAHIKEWANAKADEVVALERNLYTGDDDEKKALRAERDALRAEVERLKAHEGDLVIGSAILNGARQQEAESVDQLRARLGTAEATLAAAQEDKERIDWLADQNRREREAMSGNKEPEAGTTLIVFRDHGEWEFVEGESFRAAIDAARAQPTQ